MSSAGLAGQQDGSLWPGRRWAVSWIDAVIAKTYADDRLWGILDRAVGAGPFDGGCRIVAEALIMAFGGHLAVLQRASGVVDHYGAVIDGALCDFDGTAEDGVHWAARFSESECVPHSLFCRTDGVRGASRGVSACGDADREAKFSSQGPGCSWEAPPGIPVDRAASCLIAALLVEHGAELHRLSRRYNPGIPD